MISRKALLISAPGGDSLTMRGVNADLEATKNFLLSPIGGAWKEEEIVVLQNPTLKMLSRAVDKMEADYTITFFSGKGFPDKSGNHFLILDEGDYFQDTELLNASPKQVVIVDGCREFISETTSRQKSSVSESSKARKMYDRWIESCEPGQMIMHSTEKPTVSAFDKGGIFLQKLLQVASTIKPAKDKYNLKSILAAGHETPDLLLEEGFEEGPAITYSNGNIKLPFAMALPAPMSLLPAVRKDDLSSGLTLGLFFLAFILSLE